MTPKELIEKAKIPDTSLRWGGYSGERKVLNNRLDKDCVIAYKIAEDFGVFFVMIDKTKKGYCKKTYVFSLLNRKLINRGGIASTLSRLDENYVLEIESYLTIVDEKGWDYFKSLCMLNKIENK